MIWTADFWKGAGERAIKSFFQGIATAITADAIVSLWDLDFAQVAGIGGLNALFSFATSLGNSDFVAGKPEPVAVIEVVNGE